MTVSMGDDTRGVLRDILLDTGVSRATSDAAKPSTAGQYELKQSFRRPDNTNVAW